MSSLKQIRSWAFVSLLAAGTLRCGGDNIEPPAAARIALVAGDDQTGTVNQALAQPLVVEVTDDAGDPVAGVTVTWNANGSGSVSTSSVISGADGRASVQRVLGPDPGEATTTATVDGLEGSPITFVSTAVDGTSPKLALEVQPSSTAQSGAALVVQPVIQLQNPDGSDRLQEGLTVTASVASGNGTLGGTTARTTGPDGVAAFTDLAITGGTGEYTLRFTAPATVPVVSAPITIGGAAGSIVITANPPVAALSGEVFDPVVQPVVEVKDASGSPAAGVQVVATRASGTGTLEGTTTATTDGSGVARFGDLGISGTGTHTLQFTAGTSSVVSSPIELSPLSAKATTGEWGPVVPWDVVPLHMNLLPTGKILAWGKTNPSDTLGLPRVWDPASGPPSTAVEIGVDAMLFCAGHALMPDGTLMVSGGHRMDDAGLAVTNFFGPDGTWTKGPNMAHGRWYPTVTTLPDGRMLTMGGRDGTGALVRIPEIWENGAWTELPGASTVDIPYYPRNFVAPDGRIFYAGERIMSRWFQVDEMAAGGLGKWSDGPSHIFKKNRDYGTAAMYEPGKILYAGGGGNTGWGQSPDAKDPAPTATAEKIDLNQANPQWQSAGTMNLPRRHVNSTILPDGQVLITGGTTGGGFVNINEGLAAKEAELWNPATNQWTTLAANSVMRVYHSVSLLLPDGTVLHGASGDAMAVQPGGGVVPVPPERNHEIFSPPYMFKGVRPTIASAPAGVGYGQVFSVATPNAAQITDVRWIRLGTVTHAFDMGQRANTLTFTRTATGVDVTAPANPNLAPPGHYQIFVLNRNGVPSVGKVIRIQ
ncbi:MAG TPA: galactose oxidase-like domain-containing protein [Gemmatimonadales bacterium]|nr:galactose oxidase-like domain-containing protein [Gemmatimonadales bacterium]